MAQVGRLGGISLARCLVYSLVPAGTGSCPQGSGRVFGHGLDTKEDTCGHLWAVKALSLGQGRHKFRDQRPLIQVHGNQTGPNVMIVGKAAGIKG